MTEESTIPRAQPGDHDRFDLEGFTDDQEACRHEARLRDQNVEFAI